MKTLAFALATTAVSATAALASADINSVDRNGDRFATFSEITSVYPRLTRNDFRDIDLNRDRRISAVELAEGPAQSIIHRHKAGQGTVLGHGEVDTNGDNFVSFSELAGAYPGLNVNDWDDVDLNDDNRLGFTEFYSADAQAVVSRYEGEGTTVVSLNRLDADGSGFASLGELSGTYPGLSNIDFEQIDLNNDNRISFDELYDAEVRTVLSRSTR